MLLDGIHVPLTTPFYPDGRLNLRKLEHNVDRYSRTPAAGMLVLGAVGEAYALNDSETREALEFAIGAAGAEKVMLAEVERDGVSAALEVIEDAARLGYDAAVVAAPRVFRGSREVMTYFRAVADRAGLPIVFRGVGGVEDVVELGWHPGVIGAVLADGLGVREVREGTAGVRHEATVTPVFAAVTGRMMARAAEPVEGGPALVGVESLQGGGTAVAVAAPVRGPGIKTRVRETGFQVLTASAAGILQGLRDGAVGAIPAMAACAPQACYEVLAGWKDGDHGLAEGKQERLLAAAARLEQLGVPGIKYACDLNGYFGGRPRLPLVGVSGAEKAEIEKLMRGMRN